MLLTEEAAAEHDGVQRDEDGANVCPVEHISIYFGVVALQGVDTRVTSVQQIHYVPHSVTLITTKFTRCSCSVR